MSIILCPVGLNLSLVSYADDILNISRSIERIASIFEILTRGSADIGLDFNPEKSEIVFFNRKDLA